MFAIAVCACSRRAPERTDATRPLDALVAAAAASAANESAARASVPVSPPEPTTSNTAGTGAVKLVRGNANGAIVEPRRVPGGVALRDCAIDDLHLTGTITSGDGPRALVSCGEGKGILLKHGAYLGEEIMEVDSATLWRVDRIRSGEVRLVRRSVAGPPVKPEYRSLTLSVL